MNNLTLNHKSLNKVLSILSIYYFIVLLVSYLLFVKLFANVNSDSFFYLNSSHAWIIEFVFIGFHTLLLIGMILFYSRIDEENLQTVVIPFYFLRVVFGIILFLFTIATILAFLLLGGPFYFFWISFLFMIPIALVYGVLFLPFGRIITSMNELIQRVKHNKQSTFGFGLFDGFKIAFVAMVLCYLVMGIFLLLFQSNEALMDTISPYMMKIYTLYFFTILFVVSFLIPGIFVLSKLHTLVDMLEPIDQECKTKYPILLLHGMGFRDFKCVNYWGRIPRVLKMHGAKIYYGYQDANGSIVENSKQIASQIDSILNETKTEKLNIIAHSKGGLEARYLISSMGYSDKIASLTTLSTPHNGSKTVDVLMKVPQVIIKIGCFIVDIVYRILGDKQPNTYRAICSFRTKDAREFNELNQDSENVYYQSFSFIMKGIVSDLLFVIPWLVVYFIEGDNDGLLTPEATKWTNYRGIIKGNGSRGISHCDEVDFRRSRLSKKNQNGIDDITNVYISIAKDLIQKGM